MNHAATANFADASRNMLPDLPPPPRGWRWVGAACGGNYHLVPDPNFAGERAPDPYSGRLVPGSEPV